LKYKKCGLVCGAYLSIVLLKNVKNRIFGGYTEAQLFNCTITALVSSRKSAMMIRGSGITFPCNINVITTLSVVQDSFW
jgi:hypothetical protein